MSSAGDTTADSATVHDALMSTGDTARIKVAPDFPQSYPILIVDDDDLVRAHLAEQLGQAGYPVYQAANVREALGQFDAVPCPIVLTDWQMPDMDGLELCRELRARESDGYTYIVMLSIRSGTNAVLAGLAAGADDYVCKGAPLEELLARLQAGRRLINLERSLRRANHANRTLAHTDVLTGAFNRRHLTSHLAREIERARRYGRPLAVVACDIDHFKRINDAYGHEVGDEVLRGTVECMQGMLRTGIDWIARTGGEEFTIVLPETTLDSAALAAERIRAWLSSKVLMTSAGPQSITISAGVASVESDAESATIDELLRKADRGMYASKQSGRNRVTVVGAASGDEPSSPPAAGSVAQPC